MVSFLGASGIYQNSSSVEVIRRVIAAQFEERGLDFRFIQPQGIGATGLATLGMLARIGQWLFKLGTPILARFRRESEVDIAEDHRFQFSGNLQVILDTEVEFAEAKVVLFQTLEVWRQAGIELRRAIAPSFVTFCIVDLYTVNDRPIVTLVVEPRAIEECTTLQLWRLIDGLKENEGATVTRSIFTSGPRTPKKLRRPIQDGKRFLDHSPDAGELPSM
jgi:hypothetical protein